MQLSLLGRDIIMYLGLARLLVTMESRGNEERRTYLIDAYHASRNFRCRLGSHDCGVWNAIAVSVMM